MLLTITTTHVPATDLGYLLHKNPSRCQTTKIAFGEVHVFYPEASLKQCTAAILVDIDPIGMIRGRRHRKSGLPLDQYVNDRPYAASSFLSVAIAQVFGSALRGRCPQRPELAEKSIPLEIGLDVVPSRNGDDLIPRLFEPLGYKVNAKRLPLDEKFPEWGDSPYFEVILRKEARLSEVLNHLYVLIPVLDSQKHYFISDDEITKLLERGRGWLATHPEHELITRRYLKYKSSLAYEALARLTETDPETFGMADRRVSEEEIQEQALNLNEQRIQSAVSVLRDLGCRRVLDLGCGDGKLLKALLEDKAFTEIVGIDVSVRALESASRRLRYDRLPPMQKSRVTLTQGSLMYRDSRLNGYDAAAVLEVIEHLDPPRLVAFERSLFEFARPRVTVLTTPNAEYNQLWPSFKSGEFRHSDHRFEWSREEFESWSNRIADNYGYTVRFQPVGQVDAQKGAPTQMAIFERSNEGMEKST